MPKNNFKCHFCKICLGHGCVGQMPGMGGVNNNQNFILNCDWWDKIPAEENIEVKSENLGIAPVTGAVQNIGFKNEEDFYFPYFSAAQKEEISICVGDGAPDEKLKLGLAAVQELDMKAYFFLKPYSNARLFERVDWVRENALAVGIDIDAFNIVSMRNQAKLEKKTVAQLKEFRKYSKLPLAVKGVFTKEDIELCMGLKPEIIVVSNHGGRVETKIGSTAEFLQANGKILKSVCGELWVDGGIRKKRDIQAALTLGAKKCLVARPFISALCEGFEKGGEEQAIQKMCGAIRMMLCSR